MSNISNTTRNKVVSGTSGADSINNRAKNVTISAGAGNDIVTTYGNNVSVVGGAGNDSIRSTGGTKVTLHGGAGNDTLTGSSLAEIFQFRSDGGSDVITNFGTNDTLHIAAGSLNTYYADGNDLIVRAKGAKYSGTIRLKNAATASIKVKVGNGSIKTIKAESPSQNGFNTARDTLLTGTSNGEFMHNYASKVTIDGAAGTDTITSFGDKTSLGGGAGNDLVQNFGGLSVTLNGGAGNDTLIGSSEGETFIFGSSHGNDMITNFGKNDTLYIAKGTIGAYSVKNNDLIVPVDSVKVTLKGAAFTPVQVAYPSGVVETITGYEVPDPDGVKAFVSETLAGTFDLSTYNATAKTKAVNIYATTNKKDELSLYGDDRANEIWSSNADAWYDCYIYGNKGNDIIHCGTSRDHVHYYYGDGNDTLYGYGYVSDSYYKDEIVLHDCTVSNVKVNDSAIILNLDSSNTITLKNSFNKSITIPNIGTYTFAGYRVTNDKFAVPLGATGHFDMRDHTLSSESKITKLDASANKSDELSLYGDDRANEIWGSNADAWYDCYIYGNKGNDIIHCGTSRDHVHYYYGDGNDTLYGYGYVSDSYYKDEIVLHDCSVTDVKVNDSAIILNLDSGNTITLKNSFNKSITIPNIGTYAFASYKITDDKFAIPLGATGHFDMRDHTLSPESKITKLDASANKSDELSLYGDDRANEIWGSNADAWYDCYIYGNKDNDIIHCGTSRDHVHYYYGDGNDTLYGYGYVSDSYYRDEIILHDCSVTDVKVNDSSIVLNLDSGNTITLKDSFNKSIYIPGIGNQTYTKPSSSQMSIADDNTNNEYWFMQTDNSMGSEIDSIIEVKDISIDLPTDFNANIFKSSIFDQITSTRHRQKK